MSTAAAKYPPLVSGLVLASYYGGYTLGTAVRGSILLRVGQIRLFAALAGIVAASVAMQPVLTAAPAWILMRLVTGIGYAGLFIVAESWLNGCSNPGNRGLIFAVYLVATNAAFGGGQFLLNIPFPGSFQLFCLAATLFCLSLVPISLTHATPPALTESPRLTLKDLRRLAPVSLSGCATSGLTSSAFY